MSQSAPCGAASLGCQAQHRRRGTGAAASPARHLALSCLLVLLFLASLGSCQDTWRFNGPKTGISKNAADGISVGSENANFNLPTVAYNDSKLGLLCLQKFDDTKWTPLGSKPLHIGVSMYVKMVLDSVGAHIVGYRGDSKTISVLEFVPGNVLGAGTWARMGSRSFTGPASFLDMAVDPNNDQVYIVYRDEAVGNKASVQRFTRTLGGGSWSFVGARGFTPGEATDTRIAIGATGQVGVAAVEPKSNSRVSVWELSSDKKSWKRKGPLGAPFAGKAASVRLAYLSGPDRPVIACLDVTTASQPVVAVSRWSGSQSKWVRLANPGRVDATTRSFAFSIRDNVAHVVYSSTSAGGKATLKKSVGSRWPLVGVAGFSKGKASWLDMAWDQDGIPVVSMADASNQNKATIMQFKP